jgi:hypothetical protein
MKPDSGTTNIRNLKTKHWARWLGVESRCLVPFNSFSEFNRAEGGDIWFAFDETRPLACFAGIWTNCSCRVRRGRCCVRVVLRPRNYHARQLAQSGDELVLEFRIGRLPCRLLLPEMVPVAAADEGGRLLAYGQP